MTLCGHNSPYPGQVIKLDFATSVVAIGIRCGKNKDGQH